MKAAFKSKPFYTQYNPKGFDTFICDENKKIFAVFDGMGISNGARKAAEKCAEIVGIGTKGGEDWQALRTVLLHCINAVKQFGDPQAGCTATIVSVDNVGHLHYAHVGDSRLYVLNNGRIKQITTDEGVGNMLSNYVGTYAVGVTQSGTVYDAWQKIMLCTDGITGDWVPDLIDDEAIEHSMNMTAGPASIADSLLSISKKQDDKTVIVVER